MHDDTRDAQIMQDKNNTRQCNTRQDNTMQNNTT